MPGALAPAGEGSHLHPSLSQGLRDIPTDEAAPAEQTHVFQFHGFLVQWAVLLDT